MDVESKWLKESTERATSLNILHAHVIRTTPVEASLAHAHAARLMAFSAMLWDFLVTAMMHKSDYFFFHMIFPDTAGCNGRLVASCKPDLIQKS